jgi:uncharacterized membrane protein YkvA (DUF1232 family)
MIDTARSWARNIKRDVLAVWIAARDPRTPWYAKALATAVAVYALSPIDLIPDFIPVLGYLDDLILVPIGIVIVIRLIPADLMAEFRREALLMERKPVSRTGMVLIVSIWLICGSLLLWLLWPAAGLGRA